MGGCVSYSKNTSPLEIEVESLLKNCEKLSGLLLYHSNPYSHEYIEMVENIRVIIDSINSKINNREVSRDLRLRILNVSGVLNIL